MPGPLDRPLPLLLVTGGLIGSIFPLGKLAATAGVPPLLWAMLIAAGVAAVLAVVLGARREALPLDGRHLRYYAVAGVVSYAIPNALVFTSIPRLGAGLTSILFTFSPILTLVLANLLKTRRPNALGMVGIALGFAGAVAIVLSRGQVDAPAEPAWLALAFLIPVALAVGNVYRTLDWPAGTGGLALAFGTNAAAALFLALLSLLWTGELPLGRLRAVPGLALVQVGLSSFMFAMFFRLQRVGGPVYLSQIGYVAAAVGLVAGSWLLGESYGILTWGGALVVAIGVAVSTRAQRDDTA